MGGAFLKTVILRLAAVFLTLSVCLALAAAGAEAADGAVVLTEEERAYIAARGPVRMCVDPDWYPYEAIDENGRHWGIAADLIELIALRTGLELELVPTESWDQSLSAMEEGRCDVLSFLNESPERAQWMLFTTPYFTDPNVLITRQEHGYISDLSGLSNASVVLPEGTSIEERLRRDYPALKIILVSSEREALEFVSSRKAELTVRSLTMAAYTIRKEGLIDLKISGEIPDYENQLSMGVRRDEPMLRQILNKAIASLSSQEVQQAVNHHIPMPIQRGFDYKLFLIQTGAFFVIIAAGVLWIIQLRRLNGRLVEQKRQLDSALDRLAENEALYKSFLSASPDAVVISDANGTILVASPAAYALVGLSAEREELPGRKLLEFTSPEDCARMEDNCARLFAGQKAGVHEYRGLRADGGQFVMEVKSEIVYNPSRPPDRMVSIVRDITERRAMEVELQNSEQTLRQLAQELRQQNEQLSESATYDKLTGIRNRGYLEAQLANMIERGGNRPMAIVSFDLDHFKAVNDTYGHAAGDQVLIHTARTVQAGIRETDIFARWGGEEFLVLLAGADLETACSTAERIRSAVEQSPCPGVGRVTISVGVSEYRRGEYLHDWIKRADVEMYRAKNSGRNTVSCDGRLVQ